MEHARRVQETDGSRNVSDDAVVLPQPRPITALRRRSGSLQHAEDDARVAIDRRQAGGTPTRTEGLIAGAVALIALCMIPVPGRLVGDTKFDLVLDPGGFLRRALQLWDGVGHFGHVQNQAIGYLFPMGPFFWLGSLLRLPPWVIQRLWLATLLTVAFVGMVKLCDRLRIGRPSQRIIAGFVYALSPTFLIVLGSMSAAVLAGALMPWVVVPLLRTDSPRRAAALSAVAVACMGGINATSVLGALVLPGLVVITRPREIRYRLLAWWVGCVTLATAWWVAPLAFQGRYGFDFLDYTERAEVTANSMSALEVLRGTGNWLAYLGLQEPWSRAGSLFVHNPWVIVATSAIALVGMVGLVDRGMPHRRVLGLSFGVFVLIIGIGYAGAGGGPFGGAVQSLIDGPLGFARNLYKFEPGLRAVLALGVAHALAQVRVPRQAFVRGVAALAAVVVGTTAAYPAVSGRYVPTGSFADVPSYWRDAADFLEQNGGDARSMLVPTAAFAEYQWGRPLDEPMQGFGVTPWATRNLIPLGGPDNIVMLDSIEDIVASGTGSSGLPELLSRSGIRYLVVRNDLDWNASRSPRPSLVRQSLLRSGMRPVASFGTLAVPTTVTSAADFGVAAQEATYPAVEIYTSSLPAERARAYPADATVVVEGGVESISRLAERGVTAGRATVLRSDVPAGVATDEWQTVVSDAHSRRHVDFGLVRDNRSYVLGADEVPAGVDELRAYDDDTVAERSVAESVALIDGNATRASITASSYGSWLLQLPELAPHMAFDNDPATAWVAENDGDEPPWLQLDLDTPVDARTVEIEPLADGPWRTEVTKVRVVTDEGSVDAEIGDAPVTVALPEGSTARIRLELATDADDDDQLAGPGLREVRVDGVELGRTLRVPSTETAATSITFDRWQTNPSDLLRSDPELNLDRTFDVAADSADGTEYQISTRVVPRPGRDLDVLIDDVTSTLRGVPGSSAIAVSASSSWNDLPTMRAGHVLDGDPQTAWLPNPAEPVRTTGTTRPSEPDETTRPEAGTQPDSVDSDPTLELSWEGERTIEDIRIVTPDWGGAAAQTVEISSPAGTRTVELQDGRGTFDALTTDRVTVRFPKIERAFIDTGIDNVTAPVPLAVAEVIISGLRDLPRIPAVRSDQFETECGEGPDVTIDGTTRPTLVRGRVADLLDLAPIVAEVCGDGTPTAQLAAGTHRVIATPSAAFAPASITLQAGALDEPNEARSVQAGTWDADRRTVTIAAGDEAILTVHENHNNGWEATLQGEPLQSIVVDGWQQGFIVPAGEGGVIELQFSPARPYQLTYLAGGAAALLLVPLARWRRRRPVTTDHESNDENENDDEAGVEDVAAPAPRQPTGRPAEFVGNALPWVAAAVVGTALSPFAGLAAVACIAVAQRWAGAAAVVAISAAAASVTVAALAADDAQPLIAGGTFSAASHVLASIAIASIVGLALRPPDKRHPVPKRGRLVEVSR
jgi:arabinofuranan 3-O-arabinosyltransferase